MEYAAFAVSTFLVLVLAFATWAGALKRADVTAPMAFVAAGYWDVEGEFARAYGDGSAFAATLIAIDDKRVATGKDFEAATGLLAATADVALLDHLAQTVNQCSKSKETSISEVIIVSGDHIFGKAVKELRQKGVFTTVVAYRTTLSRSLANVCNRIIYLDLNEVNEQAA